MKKKYENEYCNPIKKKKGIIGVYRNRNTGRCERTGIETNGIDYLRFYADDIDGGIDRELSDGIVKEFFRKIKKQLL